MISKESEFPIKITKYFEKLSTESKMKFSDINEELKKIESEENQNHTQFLFHTAIIPGKTNFTTEILADKFGACKPLRMSIKVSDYHKNGTPVVINGTTFSNTFEKFVEILNITVMGNPQLINFDGSTRSSNRGISKFYNSEKDVDWQVFGTSAGQGLQITMHNPFENSLSVSIIIVGMGTAVDLIGRA